MMKALRRFLFAWDTPGRVLAEQTERQKNFLTVLNSVKGDFNTQTKLCQLMEMLVGGKAEQIVLGRNVPMCVEVDAIEVMELFAEECPQWGALAKRYRELRAQPTRIYGGKAIE